MRKESFDEIFTYVGHREREMTPEEEEDHRESLKRAKEDLEMRKKLAALGLPF